MKPMQDALEKLMEACRTWDSKHTHTEQVCKWKLYQLAERIVNEKIVIKPSEQ